MNHSDSFLTALREYYPKDKLFSKILGFPEAHPSFRKHDRLVWTHNTNKEWVVGLPKGWVDQSSIHGLVIDQAHTALGHFGAQRTSDYIRCWYWWPRMQHDIQSFCDTCEVC